MLHHLRVEAHDVISNLSNLKHKFTHSHTHESHETCSAGTHDTGNRFDSFAPKRDGNAIKWYVDGCSYFWAVSEALERATQSIWILDWWLSPELYLRRPPSRNQEYRLDRMLKAAADRGVKVNVIVYKEVAAVSSWVLNLRHRRSLSDERCRRFPTARRIPSMLSNHYLQT